MIKQIEKPEGFEEDAPVEEDPETGEIPPRNEIIYIAGRIFMDKNGRWIYESYNHCYTSDKHPDIVQTLADVYLRSEDEVKHQYEAI